MDVEDVRVGLDAKSLYQVLLDRIWESEGDLDIHEEEIEILLKESTLVMREEPNVVEVVADEVVVVGDLHGQFDDLLAIILQFFEGENDFIPETPVVFLGDYVDRGPDSIPVIALLAAFKAVCPDRVILLRGNHETRAMTAKAYREGTNFQDEVLRRYPQSKSITDLAFRWFDALPVAAVLNLPDKVRYFCVHGGIPKRQLSIDDINKLDRFVEPPLKGPLCDLMWADPIDEKHAAGLSQRGYEEFLLLDFMPNISRGCSSIFGYASLSSFLQSNDLVGVIRGHQVAPDGFRVHFASLQGRPPAVHPPLTTVFSATNYCGTHGNRAAVAVARATGLHREDFRDVFPVLEDQFCLALEADECNDRHPGWQRLRSCLTTLSLFKRVMEDSERTRSLDALTTKLRQHASDSSGQLLDLWQTLDTNGDGLLSPGEMAEFARDFVTDKKDTEVALKVAQMVSDDWQEAMGRDSSVSYTEFKEYVRALHRAVGHSSPKSIKEQA